MKKLLLFIICLSTFASLSAKSFNEEQLALRQNIFNFLKEEGYVPEIDSDGDIRFKSEGSTYYVIISEGNTSPMYLVLYHGFNYSEKYSKSKIESIVNEIAMYKGLKLLPSNDSYSLRFEMYLENADHFRYTFYKHLSVMKEARKEIQSLINP